MQPVQFVAKHGFQGDPRQSQLAFPAGATLLAKPNQDGAWWWGSFSGREGWFPPSYVAPAAVPPTGAFVPQGPMQQAAFAPSVPQQRVQQAPPAAAFASGPPPLATTARPMPTYEPADPFAGLGNMGVQNAPSGPAPPSPLSTASTASGTPSLVSGASPTSAAGPPALTAPARSSSSSQLPPVAPQQSKMDSAAAALARLGVSPPVSKSSTAVPTPSGSRTVSPVPPKPSASGMSSASGVSSVPSSRGTSPAPSATTTSAPNSRGPSPAPPASAFGTKANKPLSQEEEKARRLREQEESRLKAQLLKEKEEALKSSKDRAAQVASGLGISGVTLSTTYDGEVEVGLPPPPPGSFNPYGFLAGGDKLPERKFSPIQRVPPFWALLELNTYVHQRPVPPEKLADRTAMYEQLARALSFVSHVCVETKKRRKGKNPLAFLETNHMACEACIKLISLLPHSAGASGSQLDGLFLNFLNVFISLMENVQTNQQLVLPGGWQQPDYTYLCLYIVRNCGNNRWSFTVCNTGRDGLQYHPATFDPETGRELKQLSMTIWDIPASRLMDSSFWAILFRMQVYPSRKNNAAFLYTKLLPALNSRPLLSNLDQGPSEYLEVPDPISAQSYHPLARLALTTTPATGMRGSKYATLLLKNAAVQLAFDEIEDLPASSMDPEDSRILKLTGRNLANYASTIQPNTVGDGSLGASLSDAWDLLDRLLKKINFSSSKPMDQYSHGLPASAMTDDFATGKIVSLKTGAGSAAFPLFGRLRRDNYAEVVKKLMGEPRPDPILIPPVLTDEELPPVATDYSTATSYLQRIADACSLLLQQRRLIKNASAFAASAAQYAMTTVLPMPNLDPKFCFWRKNPMRRETQLYLLFLIRRICRIYSAATTCVQESRGLIAIRSTAFASAACVSDAICRVVAVDDPSAFALHYSGLCEGPTEPFAIEAGAFDTLGSNLPIYDPNMCSLRFQCLDYLRGLIMKMDGSRRHTIFNFDKSLSPTEGDLVLLDQLSIQLALQRPFPKTEQAMMNHCASLIGGRNGSMIEVLPEFEYFRDIVFHFRQAVSGKAQTPEVPEHHIWLPSDATLHWTVRRNEKDKEDPFLSYHVTAFHGHPQLFVERIAQQEEQSKKKAFKGFLSLFSSKSRIERSRLSSADATTVVNSCGEKFLKKR